MCDFGTVPVYVRPGSVLPVGARDDRPDYAYDEGVALQAVPAHLWRAGNADGARAAGDTAAAFEVARAGGTLTATRRRGKAAWRLAGARRTP